MALYITKHFESKFFGSNETLSNLKQQVSWLYVKHRLLKNSNGES